ncbi:hypothetical protein HOM13_02165 [Candidatus Woesearchaeota archaeon]|jgi:hypothetical protein|nr:hypothetical protein [Candidatus Woesearchaeota archaeon]MBT5215519.1 hypothetical protein [Candidatus Woesearchaeota archaeon]MBT6402240.1 hypothetical protein [Candidatus Woesearchaeota archaeon]
MKNELELIPDQVVRSCRECRSQQRHYRMGDMVLEGGQNPVADFQCMGCMGVRTILLRRTDFFEEEIYETNKRSKRN